MQQRPRTMLKWLPYVLPLALFLLATSMEQMWGYSGYPIIYTIKIIALLLLLLRLRSFYPELKFNKSGVVVSLLLGPLLCALWIVVDRVTPHFSFLGSRSAYDPFTSIDDLSLAWIFVVIRFFGLVTIAPIIEELFFRAFLLRWIIDPDHFDRIPLGTYNLTAFIGVVVLMASAHPEYLAAALFSAIMNALLYRTKNLWATIAAHGSTNLCLGIYVIVFHAWKYW